jgi:hypothetical protein
MRWLRMMALMVLVASCTEGTDATVDLVPSTPPSTAPSPSSSLLPPDALPVPLASPWPIQPNSPRDHPRSADVGVGESRRFELYTHCGIDFRVDFDGSFWQSYNVGQKTRITDPFQKGTMTLLTGDVAAFRFGSGDRMAAVFFVRNDSPKPAVVCD